MKCPKCNNDTAAKNKENYKVQIENCNFGKDLIAKNVEVNRCLMCDNVWLDKDKYNKVLFEAVSQAWLDDTWFWKTKELKDHPSVNVISAMGKEALPWLIQKCISQPYHWDIILNKILKENNINNNDKELVCPKIITTGGTIQSDIYTTCAVWIRWAIQSKIIAAKIVSAHPEIEKKLEQFADKDNYTDILFEFVLIGDRQEHFVTSKSLYKWATIYSNEKIPTSLKRFGKILKNKIKLLSNPPENDLTCMFNYPVKVNGEKKYGKIAVRRFKKDKDNNEKTWINLRQFIKYIKYGAGKAARSKKEKIQYLKVVKSLSGILEMSKKENQVEE